MQQSQLRETNKPFCRAHFIALRLFPFVITSLVLLAALYVWHLQLTSALQHDRGDRKPSPQPHQRSTTCGSTPAEARSRGCRFDILSFAWQTHECFDAELMQDFLRHDNWRFYAHPNRTDVVVDVTTALKGERTLYVDWKYHVAHCTFAWRQLHRAYAVRGYIDSHLDSYGHTLHCQGVLLDRETPLGVVRVIAEVRYPECRRIGGLRGMTAGHGPFAASRQVDGTCAL